jgi:hypothetical protein
MVISSDSNNPFSFPIDETLVLKIEYIARELNLDAETIRRILHMSYELYVKEIYDALGKEE